MSAEVTLALVVVILVVSPITAFIGAYIAIVEIDWNRFLIERERTKQKRLALKSLKLNSRNR